MKLQKVTDPAFRKYGKIVENVDFSALVEELKKTPCTQEVVYEPSVESLEALRHLPLRILSIAGCAKIRDFSPLLDLHGLEILIVPRQMESSVLPLLRNRPGVVVLNDGEIGGYDETDAYPSRFTD